MEIVNVLLILLSAAVGWLLEKVTVRLIQNRKSEMDTIRFTGTRKNTFVWMAVNMLGWTLAILFSGVTLQSVEFMLLYSACLVLSAVDINIRKIPNDIILFILAIGLVTAFMTNGVQAVQNGLIGLIAGFVIFFLPALIGKGAGLGDVKFAAAAGFCLGIYDFLTAIIIMTLVLVVYTVYLIITGKGNLKTKLALGPFMASGMVTMMLLNITQFKPDLFNLEMLLKL